MSDLQDGPEATFAFVWRDEPDGPLSGRLLQGLGMMDDAQLRELLRVGCEVQPPAPTPAPGIPLIDAVRVALKNTDKAWYEATRVFGSYNYHPHRCEDWNLETGGDTDLGEPLVAPFNGLVLAAHNYGGGAGRNIQILGRLPDGALIVWAGWHLEKMSVTPGQIVAAGEDIGTIGNADGRYAAHLHEQICVVNEWGVPGPTTFASDSRYAWQQPSVWYVRHGVDQMLMTRLTKKDQR